MLLTPELSTLNFAGMNEVCFPVKFDLGPVHVDNTICFGLASEGPNLVLYVKNNGSEIFRRVLSNLCHDLFSVGIARVRRPPSFRLTVCPGVTRAVSTDGSLSETASGASRELST